MKVYRKIITSLWTMEEFINFISIGDFSDVAALHDRIIFHPNKNSVRYDHNL